MTYWSHNSLHMGECMKALGLFGAAGVVTAAVTGGPAGLAIGNLAIAAMAAALLLFTVNIEKAPRDG